MECKPGDRVTFPITETRSGVGTVESVESDGTVVIDRSGSRYLRPATEIVRSADQGGTEVTAPRKPSLDRKTACELRENDWSWEGIARIYGITPAAVKLIATELAEPTGAKRKD